MLLTVFRPKRPEWFRGFAIAALGVVVVYVIASWLRPWSAGAIGGLTFGTLAALIFVAEALYPLRRRLMAWPLGTAQRWLQFHVYAGPLAALCVLVHIDFRFPAGQFGWWLLVLTIWTSVTGLLGVYLQKYIPLTLTSNLSTEAIYERIPDLIAKLVTEADQLLVGAPDLLTRFYLTDVRGRLVQLSPSWGYLFDIRADRERRLAPFGEIAAFASTDDRVKLNDLRAIVAEKLELDVHFSLQRVLRIWIPVHAFPAIALIALIVIHVGAVLLF